MIGTSIPEIANMPTVINTKDYLVETSVGLLKHEKFHESLCRSYHIVAKLKSLLEQNTPTAVILEILGLMQSDDFQPYAWHEKRCLEQFERVITEPAKWHP